jgi:hypothetical protein
VTYDLFRNVRLGKAFFEDKAITTGPAARPPSS